MYFDKMPLCVKCVEAVYDFKKQYEPELIAMFCQHALLTRVYATLILNLIGCSKETCVRTFWQFLPFTQLLLNV